MYKHLKAYALAFLILLAAAVLSSVSPAAEAESDLPLRSAVSNTERLSESQRLNGRPSRVRDNDFPASSPAFPSVAQERKQSGRNEQKGAGYYANPVPLIADPATKAGLMPAPAEFRSDQLRRQLGSDCYEYVVNNSFEEDGGWFGQPLSNIGYSDIYWYSGSRSLFLNTNFYSNSAVWQPISVPTDVESVQLSFWSGIVLAEPEEIVYFSIYDDTFGELIYWDFLQYTVEGWNYFSTAIPAHLLAGRDIQLTFQTVQDYDDFYGEIVLDDVSFVLCSSVSIEPPTPAETPTVTSTPTPQPPTATATATPTLLPSNTPTQTPAPATTAEPGAPTIDLSIQRIQVGQALMAAADPITNAPIPLIAEKPALARVYVATTGATSEENVDATLFMRDAQGTTTSFESINGPIRLTGDSIEGDARTTINFMPNALMLKGNIELWAEVDPANLVVESNESNNRSNPESFTFASGNKLRIAWVEVNQGGDRGIAEKGDTDLRKFFPVGVNDVAYYFQPGFNQPLNTPLTVQSYSEYLNALNRFWDRMTHEGSWVGGTAPDRLYGWAAGQHTGLCGVADARWVGGRGRVATGYALQCGAETMAHELGHILDRQGLRHSPNLPTQQDANCVGEPAGAEPLYPTYPNLPLGSIGAMGFDATKRELLFPAQTYDFMSYCEKAWVSPFNYSRLSTGFAPVGAAGALNGPPAESAKLLVSGLVYTGTIRAELDPFYVIRSDQSAEADTGEDFCVELRNAESVTVTSRCFNLGFINIETGSATEVDGFSLVIPYAPDTTEVVLTHAGTSLASRSVSRNQPFVRLTSPSGGEKLSGTSSVTVTWNGADLDEDTLYYSLSYSIDNGESWLPLATDLTTTSHVVDLSQLPGTTQAKFRVGASDGINTVYDTSDGLEIGFVGNSSIVVSGKPPVAAIRSDTLQIEAGRAVILEGTGYDLEDGLLPEENLTWWSNRDGELGSGSWLQTGLSVGEHVISLRVTDSAGNTHEDNLTLAVGTSAKQLFLPYVVR